MRIASSFVVAASLLGVGCAGGYATPAADEVEDGFAVPGGKEDNFFSLEAKEFLVRGTTTVTLEEELADAAEADKLARVQQLISLKHISFAWFMTEYLLHKDSDEANNGWGGAGGLNKAGSYRELDITAVDARTYSFTFQHIIVGPTDLISKLPTRTEGGKTVFDLVVGKPTNEQMALIEMNEEWYRQAPWDAWDPATAAADIKETLTLSIEPERASTDSWFDYQKLFADGVLDIDVHFGWDYHDAYHVKHARALFGWLKTRGFTAPVASFDDLTRTSGAFKKTIDANGTPVEVQVRIFYGKTGSDNDTDTAAGGIQLEADMRASLASRDVIVYSGHSGPFYGFALANWKKTPEGDLDDSEMTSVTMPANRYQVVMAEGCDTYQIGQAFAQNPAKPGGALIDVITTTQASNASSPEAVQHLISRLVELDSQSRHRPRTLKSLLTDLDDISPWFHTMYGIHGIDDSPKLHPYAALDKVCQSCSSNTACGAVGNLCIKVGTSGKRCAPACTDDAACPTGYKCGPVASSASNAIYARACVPTNLTCQ